MPYYFELPDITELTVPQQAVLTEPESISVYGGPGTGKSIVSLWRHIRNYDTNAKKSLLLTYTMTLVAYLSGAARNINTEAADNVAKTQLWLAHNAELYDEIIIDEAQDLPLATYQQVKQYANEISYGADDQQSLYPAMASNKQQLKAVFPDTKPYPLDENFRNSYEILLFVRATLPRKVILQNTIDMTRAKRSTQIKPRVLITGNNRQKENQAILDLIGRFYSPTHNIGVLVPLPSDVDATFGLVSSKFTSTMYHHNISVLPVIENVHVTTYASAKGIEFDTVIMPQFENMRKYIPYMRAASENHYYVAFTRAKTNLFLISTMPPNDIDASTYELEQL